MEEQNKITPETQKINLKHDNMEYSASTEGDDILDSDRETIGEMEEEEITAEELELLQGDDVDDQAEALNTAETDSQADEDNFLNETEIFDELEDTDDDEKEEEIRR